MNGKQNRMYVTHVLGYCSGTKKCCSTDRSQQRELEHMLPESNQLKGCHALELHLCAIVRAGYSSLKRITGNGGRLLLALDFE